MNHPQRSRSLDAFTRPRHPRIPTGFCLNAQGCEARATLGHRQETSPTATRLRPVRSRPRTWPRPQRRWRCFHFPTRTQGRRWARQPWAEGRNPFGIVCTRTRFDFVTLPCYRESQRDSVLKPRVARHELPWVIGQETSPTATRLRPVRSARAPGFGHNAVGVVSTSQRAPKVGAVRANLGLKDAIPLGLFARTSRIVRPNHSRDSDNESSTTFPFS